MALSAADVSAYLQRIGYTGPTCVSEQVLRDLVLRHTLTFPFENLDVHLGRPISLDSTSLMQKLVHGGRGGYCFEGNGLFALILQALGFRFVITWLLSH